MATFTATAISTTTHSPLFHSTPTASSHLSRVSFRIPKSPLTHLSTTRKAKPGAFDTTCYCSAEAAKDTPAEFRYEAFPTVMDIHEIQETLPHRFPFLLVDRVIELNRGVSIVGIKNVTINESYFAGHFPARPIVPGVLMIEAMAQVAGLLMLQPELVGRAESFFLVGLDNVRFRKPVVAGDTLVMRATLIKWQKLLGIANVESKGYVGGELVCSVNFKLYVGEAGKAGR